MPALIQLFIGLDIIVFHRVGSCVLICYTKLFINSNSRRKEDRDIWGFIVSTIFFKEERSKRVRGSSGGK